MIDVDEVMRLIDTIRPLLAGKPPPVQGAVLADLLAIWLAGHRGGNRAETSRLRADLLKAHIAMVRKLIDTNPENEAMRDA